MTDNEKLVKIWEYVEGRLADIDNSRYKDAFDWGEKCAFTDVQEFMDSLRD